jgi:hypothetical protein
VNRGNTHILYPPIFSFSPRGYACRVQGLGFIKLLITTIIKVGKEG